MKEIRTNDSGIIEPISFTSQGEIIHIVQNYKQNQAHYLEFILLQYAGNN